MTSSLQPHPTSTSTTARFLSSLAFALLAFLPQEEPASEVLELTPPPDQYDVELDRRLFEAWGGKDSIGGSFDPDSRVQAPAIRPTTWELYNWPVSEWAPADRLERILTSTRGEVLGPHVLTDMPASGLLEGPFTSARSRVFVELDQVRFVRAPGASKVIVNESVHIGDPEQRGWLGVPVALEAGWNTIWVDGIQTGFELELWQPMSRLVIASWAVEDIDCYEDDSNSMSAELRFALFNASTQTAENIHLHYGRAGELSIASPRLSEWTCGGMTPPLCLDSRRMYPFSFTVELPPEWWKTQFVPLAAFSGNSAHADRRILAMHPVALEQRRTDRGSGVWTSSVRGHAPLLAYETNGTPLENRLAFDVARHAQQELWYREGIIGLVREADWLQEQDERFWNQARRRLFVFGFDRELKPGSLRVSEVQTARPGLEIRHVRGADPAGLRLAYSVSPLFQAEASRDYSSER